MAVRGQEGQTTEVDVARAAAGSTNVAVVQDRYGSAAVLRLATIARPEVADHEVLIRVQAAGLDRGVWHLMAGRPYLVRLAFGIRRRRNRVPGTDLAGTIITIGAGVTSWSVGDEVFGSDQARRCWSWVPPVASAATPSSWPSPSEPR